MYNANKLNAIIATMSQRIKSQKLTEPILIGIHSGGAWLAERLRDELNAEFGTLDISFYRDDFSRVGLNPQVRASDLPHTIDNRDIVLVDDVLHTGRTIRAALDEIFSYGRPERVCLAVLIERPGRELPIQADVVGESLKLKSNEHVKLTRDNGELALSIVKAKK